LEQLSNYREARALAAEIAQIERGHQDMIFSDAMHVAVALALQDEGLSYTKRNAARMFDCISPGEVHAVLRFRLENPEDYAALPMARMTEAMTQTDVATANALAGKLTPEEVDALFFSDIVGHA